MHFHCPLGGTHWGEGERRRRREGVGPMEDVEGVRREREERGREKDFIALTRNVWMLPGALRSNGAR